MKPDILNPARAWAGSLLLAGSLVAAPLPAAEPPPATPSARGSTVTFITGGVGETERSQINEISEAFNLRVVTAKTNGDYLSGVNLTIRNEKGAPMLSTVTQGPLLLAQLPPGKYTVTANLGSEVRQEVVMVDRARQAVVLMHLADA